MMTFLVHHNGLPEAKGPDRLGDRVDGVIVQARIVGVGLDLGNVA
jgi:hypothetical protein